MYHTITRFNEPMERHIFNGISFRRGINLTPQLLSLNAWTMRQLQADGRRISADLVEYGIAAMKHLRTRAYREWYRRLHRQGGIDGMDEDLYAEFLRDQFVAIWQTIGRLLRGGREARVYFVDGAFAPGEGHRHMLRDWYRMLEALVVNASDDERTLAQWLYGAAWNAFQAAVKNGEWQ